ncbi:MAG: OHCU decarboxylase [Rhodospirillales bacterium 20-60-12]|nr:MAG: OHCU decarboxylase [Rhodospirillales bacterium 20-60-12]
MPTLEQLNAMDRVRFTATLAALFEHSPWVVEQAFSAGPFASLAALHEACLAAMRAAPAAAQLALINAHPDLAGKAARIGELTADSAREQSGAGLDRLSAAEFARFHALNHAYREKFGFPFIICVRHHDRASIMDAFERRIGAARDTEIANALSEISEIARFRLLDLSSPWQEIER